MNVDLSQLKDIHLPQKPPFLPLALGWWLVILGVLIALMTIAVVFVLYWTSLRRTTRQEFKKLQYVPDGEYLPALNRLLKRVAIHKAPEAASLYGKDWFSFLNKTKGVHFTQEDVDLFEKRLYYGCRDMTQKQREHIHACAALWLKHNL